MCGKFKYFPRLHSEKICFFKKNVLSLLFKNKTPTVILSQHGNNWISQSAHIVLFISSKVGRKCEFFYFLEEKLNSNQNKSKLQLLQAAFFVFASKTYLGTIILWFLVPCYDKITVTLLFLNNKLNKKKCFEETNFFRM